MTRDGRSWRAARAVRAPELTAEEQKHARTVLRFLRSRCGTWAAVARVLGCNITFLRDIASGRMAVSAFTAFRLARICKVPVDDVVTGKFPPVDLCPHCGRSGPREGIDPV